MQLTEWSNCHMGWKAIPLRAAAFFKGGCGGPVSIVVRSWPAHPTLWAGYQQNSISCADCLFCIDCLMNFFSGCHCKSKHAFELKGVSAGNKGEIQMSRACG